MDKSSKPAKPSYPELIRARAEKLYAQAEEADSSDKQIQLIYDALKATALESWKNGLDAGRRRAEEPAAKPQRFRPMPSSPGLAREEAPKARSGSLHHRRGRKLVAIADHAHQQRARVPGP